LLSTRLLLKGASSYWVGLSIFSDRPTSLLSTPSNSNVNSPARSSWRPLYGGEYFRYSESILTDILSKREFLYRNYFTNKGLRLALPPFLVSSPLNPFLLELQNLYSFTDPIYISSESSR
jgi:hypothetical protein